MSLKKGRRKETERLRRIAKTNMSEIKLGELITEPQQRDAIHIAVAPVVAGETLEPGQHVGFTDDGKVGATTAAIGIVDPLLLNNIEPGQKFWLWLYPKTVTNLRHDWTHPAFVNKQEHDVEESNKWLTKFAEEGDYTLIDLIAEARNAIADQTYCITLGTDTPSRWYEEVETFWKHIEIVTGLKVPDKTHTPFSCAC